MSRYLSLALCVMVGSTVFASDNKEQGRLENCGVVMEEILNVPDNIPQELLEEGGVRDRDSVDDEDRGGPRWQLRSRRDGLSVGQGVHRSLGRTGDVCARRRQLRLCSSVGNRPMSSCSS
jgi:hypothetical protein